ncbi:MAG: TetR/AcrR family transcriptional regulator [Bacteroidales bacterium]|jgi:AcrR family transcriptional regulator|nr:TetR/AcrR family transcriptional regulator [Bacteroidales bacterium]
MPKTKEQYETMKAEKRRIIMDAALALFAADGYAHTSIDKIAKRANMAKGLLYSYFKSKDDLLQQILNDGVMKLSDGLFAENMTPETFIESIEKVFEIMETHKDFYRLYTALSIQPAVTEKLGPLTDSHRGLHSMIKFFYEYFGENAEKELLLLTTLSKGFSILSLFGDRQHTIPLELLKETITDCIKERFGLKDRRPAKDNGNDTPLLTNINASEK